MHHSKVLSLNHIKTIRIIQVDLHALEPHHAEDQVTPAPSKNVSDRQNFNNFDMIELLTSLDQQEKGMFQIIKTLTILT